MIRYTQTQGFEPFNWFEALKKKRKDIHDWKLLQYRSNLWVTCACGNLCDIIPRDEIGSPIDWILRMLGYDFNTAIQKKYNKKALSILKLIEKRSTYLIFEITCKSK